MDDHARLLRHMCDRFYGFPDVTADLTAAADELVRLRALLGNAVGAIIDSGGYCEGPHDVADAIYRLTRERDELLVRASDETLLTLARLLDDARAVGGAPGVSETHTDPKEAPDELR